MKSQALIHEAATDTLFCELEARTREPREIADVKRGLVRLHNTLERIAKKEKKARG